MQPLSSIHDALLLAPLGLGAHVDHLTVRRAACGVLPRSRLAFYEDLPYAMWSDTQRAALLAEISATLGATLKPVILRSRFSLFAKRAACARYRSQIHAADVRAIADFSRRYGSAERIWTTHPAQWLRLGSCALNV